MNKKFNNIIFILVATVVNIIIILLLIFIPSIVLWFVLGKDSFGSILQYLIMILPLLAIIGGFLIYIKLYDFFRSKVDTEKYFEPFFKKK